MTATSTLTLIESEALRKGDKLEIAGAGMIEVLDANFPVMRKHSQIIQRSFLVKNSEGKQKLLIVADDKAPCVVDF